MFLTAEQFKLKTESGFKKLLPVNFLLPNHIFPALIIL